MNIYWHIQMHKPFGSEDETEIDPLACSESLSRLSVRVNGTIINVEISKISSREVSLWSGKAQERSLCVGSPEKFFKTNHYVIDITMPITEG